MKKLIVHSHQFNWLASLVTWFEKLESFSGVKSREKIASYLYFPIRMNQFWDCENSREFPAGIMPVFFSREFAGIHSRNSFQNGKSGWPCYGVPKRAGHSAPNNDPTKCNQRIAYILFCGRGTEFIFNFDLISVIYGRMVVVKILLFPV